MKTLLFILLVTLASINEIKSECFELLQQYYECKHLVMINPNNDSNSNFPPSTYIPNPSIPNNQLNDTFFQSLNLAAMNFDQAMNLFRSIYNETFSCSSEFCKCVTTGLIDQYTHGKYNRFSLFFRNQTNFEQMKIILLAFLVENQPRLLSNDVLESYFALFTHGNQSLPTLVQFCKLYDYTDDRFYYYDSYSYDCVKDDIVTRFYNQIIF